MDDHHGSSWSKSDGRYLDLTSTSTCKSATIEGLQSRDGREGREPIGKVPS